MEEWLTIARERFRQTRLHALEAHSRHLREAGVLCEAMECAMTVLEGEPLRESTHRQVTEIHLAEGNVHEALRHYETYRRILRERLAVPPSTAYRRLLAPYLSRPLDT